MEAKLKVFAVVALIGFLAGIAAPSHANQISIDGTCTTPGASCSFGFSGDPTSSGRDDFLNTKDVDSFFVTDPDGNLANTELSGRWRPTGDIGAFDLVSGANNVRVDFTSFNETTGLGLFSILLQAGSTGVFVPFLSGGVAVTGSYSVTAVPLPAAAWFFVTALSGMVMIRRRRLAA